MSSNASSAIVSTLSELTSAAASEDVTTIQVSGAITGVKSLLLKPGSKLEGAANGAALIFDAGQDGVGVAKDNTIIDLELKTEPHRSAVYLQAPHDHFGSLKLERLNVVGCIGLIAEGNAGPGDAVTVKDVHIAEADARNLTKGPVGFGVEIVPAAFTLLNRRTSPDSRIQAEVSNISAGSSEKPIQGTGILFGGTPGGGEISCFLETGTIHSNSGLPPGTADRISGGVFVVQGAFADEGRNVGSVSTYGTNDMVLDNWGVVERWTALADCTSYGPSSIGFVQLGQIGTISIEGVLETHGAGSCGFNAGEVKQASDVTSSKGPEAGEVREATFKRIVTHGDGAIGVQVSVPEGRIIVKNGIETFGGVGSSLARGVVMKLAATALSIKPGGAAEEIHIENGLITHGHDVQPLELLGQVGTLHISGNVGPAP